jgi:hypothetical protein
MLQAATTASSGLTLPSKGHLGDAACVGIDPEATPTIDFKHTPTITISATLTGHSSDPFGGHGFVCLPGTDTFGCQPCMHLQVTSGDLQRLFTTAKPFVSPDFFSWYQAWSAGENGSFNVEDMETAGVAKVAMGKAPFIGFRSPSDGTAKGDPLVQVPGPFGFLPQFLTYRQYAADNAATVALAFLREWRLEHP